jgi:uncharacterized protein
MLPLFAFGLLFGFILSRVGATSYDAIANMFLLRDLQLMGVIGLAILVGGVGLWLFRHFGVRSASGGQLEMAQKPRSAGNLFGGLLFGAGWALAGACPGTALAQLGEGKIYALFTISGILAGTQLYRKLGLSALPGRRGCGEWSPGASAAPAQGAPVLARPYRGRASA